MTFKPTQEQQDIIREFQSLNMLKINACAGSGKSSTLKLLAAANPQRSLYIAFNKAIADEAAEEFPSHVECRTTHSLAFAKFGKQLMHKLNRPRGGYVNVAGTPAEIAKYYRIDAYEDGEHIITEKAIAAVVKDSVRIYEQSDDETLQRKHVSQYRIQELCKSREGVDKSSLVNYCLKWAKRLWKDRMDVHSNVLATHDTYLKLYQLSNPKLNYDIIYLDEGQDSSAPVLDIVMKQTHAKIVIVGDTYQGIYAFRGAHNAMEQVNCATMYLTKSFRYGQDIADAATTIIGGAMQIKGFDKVESVLGAVDSDSPYTILFRTNGELLQEASRLIMEGVEISCEIDTNDFRKLVESGVSLFKDDYKSVKHDSVVPYGTWAELEEAAKDEPELKRLVKIVTGDPARFIQHLKMMKKKDDAHVVLTTAHKSKGRQWSQVVLANDFPEPNEDTGRLPEQERNLLYVAATRAINVLQTNSAFDMLDEISGKMGE